MKKTLEEIPMCTAQLKHVICTTPCVRVYYLIMTAIFAITLLIEVVSLGSFGVQFSRTRSFWVNNVNGDSKVCVLYGSVSNGINPELTNNASCGFVLWALISIVIVLIVWTVYYVILAVIGYPKVTSLLRLLDLIMACAMAFLSLIVSSVLTSGLYKTCGSFNAGVYSLPCKSRRFEGVGTSETLAFFGNLEGAKDASWVGMVVFTLLACWSMVLLILHCCFSQTTEEKTKLIGAKEDEKKNLNEDFPESKEEKTKLIGVKEHKKKSLDEDFPDSPKEEMMDGVPWEATKTPIQ